MTGIFNSAVFNTPIFNTGDITPVVVVSAGGGGRLRWRDETEANARKHILAKMLQKKRNQEEQLERVIRKLEKKLTPEAPDAFLQRIEENHRKLLSVRENIVQLEYEFSEAKDYIDRILDTWAEEDEEEDDFMLLQ